MNKQFFLLLSVALLFAMLGCTSIKEESHGRKIDDTGGSRELTVTVGEKEMVKIIVRLDVSGIEELTRSAARLKDPAEIAGADRVISEKINAVADLVINRLKDTRYKINYRYDSLPLLSMDVSAEALRILEVLPEVLDITEDRPVPLH